MRRAALAAPTASREEEGERERPMMEARQGAERAGPATPWTVASLHMVLHPSVHLCFPSCLLSLKFGCLPPLLHPPAAPRPSGPPVPSRPAEPLTRPPLRVSHEGRPCHQLSSQPSSPNKPPPGSRNSAAQDLLSRGLGELEASAVTSACSDRPCSSFGSPVPRAH